MSQPIYNYNQPQPGYVTPTPQPKRKFTGIIVAALVALLVGLGIGVAVRPAPEVRYQTVEITSFACKQFVRDADEMNELSAEGFGIFQDVLTHISIMDEDALLIDTDRMQDLSTRIQEHRIDYDATKEECLNG